MSDHCVEEQDSPVFRDLKFRKKAKKQGFRETPAPQPPLEAPVADTHAHLGMLADPALALARAAAHGVDAICCMTEATDDATRVFDRVDGWVEQAEDVCTQLGVAAKVPDVVLSCGVHPHEAKRWDAAVERDLRGFLDRTACTMLGEIGLDYHYDLSPRAVQREVFARQVEMACELGLPISLHMREAHWDGLAVLRETGIPQAGCILHCFNLGVDDVVPWINLGCFIAVGGPVTFGSCDALRDAVPHIPVDRLLTETDCPYMTPAPMRGVDCEPAHTIFTAAKLAEVRGLEPGDGRKQFLESIHRNARSLLFETKEAK